MIGRGAKPETPAQRRDSLEQQILEVRHEQRARQYQLEEAVTAELQALTLLDQSRGVQDRCRRKVAECAEAISSLQDEISALIPRQRES